MYYIDFNRNKYLNLEEYYKKKSFGKIKCKELLKSKRFIIIKNKEIIYSSSNIQSLYLYPLNILDYVKYACLEKTLMFNILNMNNLDNKTISNTDIKNVEILINKMTVKDIEKIIELCQILKNKGIYISYNLKTLNISKEYFIKLCNLGDYFKIHLENILGTDEYTVFLNKIKFLKYNSSEESVIHIKGYLNIDQVKYYNKSIIDFKEIVDVFQISKELIPINVNNNPKIEESIQKKVRELEKKNNIFISVKDLTTLYYPRFELDERNSHKCFVYYLKPYILDNKLLPCKVNKVIQNINDWSMENESLRIKKNDDKNYGENCKDCASIFENDILAEIIHYYSGNCNFLLEIEE